VSARWSWAALAAALVVWIAGFPTFGLSVALAPLTLGLSLVAWKRSPHDAVLWIGVALNALLAVAFVSAIVAVLIGEASVGYG
jgi:hypothetical protein